jgi:hypothetical protein
VGKVGPSQRPGGGKDEGLGGVLLVSIPKSGTHLIASVLSRLGYSSFGWVTVGEASEVMERFKTTPAFQR